MSRAKSRRWVREVEERGDAFAVDLEAVIAAALTTALLDALSVLPIDLGDGPVVAAGGDDLESGIDLRPLAKKLQKNGTARGAAAIIAAADQIAADQGVTRAEVLASYDRLLAADVAAMSDPGEPAVEPGTPMPADVAPKLDASTFAEMLDDAETQLQQVVQVEAGTLASAWGVHVPGNIDAAGRVVAMLGDIEDRARTVLSSSVTSALAEGWSVERTARRMVDSGAFEKAAARNYARTAINASQNAAHHTMFSMVAREGDMLEWVAANNAKTRPSHRAASGQRVKVGEMFTVGGYPAKHPGDTSLPGHEVYGCRCVMVLLAVEDLDDDPIHDPEGWVDRNPTHVEPDPEVEKMPDPEAVTADAGPPGSDYAATGAMVCFRPDNPEALAVDDGLPADEMHMTLLYLGNNDDLYDFERERVDTEVSKVASRIDAFDVSGGRIEWLGGPDVRDAGYVAVVVVWHDQVFRGTHDLIRTWLNRAGIESPSEYVGDRFTAHMTLGYWPLEVAEARWPEGETFRPTVRWATMSAVFGPVSHDYPLPLQET